MSGAHGVATGLGSAEAPTPHAGRGPTGAIPCARKRNWRGQFVKRLKDTPPDSREWLIWSRYHNAWHCRSAEGGACGYTNDISRAGVFVRAKADSYNDGDRNEAFHVSEKLPLLLTAMRRHNEALAHLRMAVAIAMQCKHEDAKRLSPEGVAARAEGIAQTPPLSPNGENNE